VILDKLLTRKGWRIVAHCMLAASGLALLYLLSRMITESIRHGYQLNPWILGIAIVLSLWSVALGGMLARSELTDWRG
jgi:Na+/alanine symporter